jgi:predicted dehydrogenase
MYTHRATYGGTIPWVAVHAMDWIQWYTGGRITEVAAAHTVVGNRGHGEMESSGACFYRLANSGSAIVSFDYFRPRSALTHGDDRVRIAGEKGVLEVTSGEATLYSNEAQPRLLPKEEPRAIFVEFVRRLEDGSPMRISAEDAFAVCEVALRSREAADTKSIVRIGGGA